MLLKSLYKLEDRIGIAIEELKENLKSDLIIIFIASLWIT